MICRHKLYHFMVANFSFTATRQRSGKTGICDRKMIQFMPANHSNTNCVITILIHSDKTRFQNVFVMLLRRVAKDVTSSLKRPVISLPICVSILGSTYFRHKWPWLGRDLYYSIYINQTYRSPDFTIMISEVWYLLLSSCHITEILFKQHKSIWNLCHLFIWARSIDVMSLTNISCLSDYH